MDQLSAGYGAIQVLWDVSLDVNEGEVVALLGPNGAGKTTLLRAVSGLVKPSAGNVLFGDLHLEAQAPHLILEAGIAHVPEGRGLFTPLSVQENLQAGGYRRPASGLARSQEEVEELFPFLRERRGQIAGTLSGGEQQMLAIARALMAKPKLLLLDEPSLGLMPKFVNRLFEALAVIRRDMTILLVEQNAQVALSLADRCYVLENGRIAYEGTSAEALESNVIVESYLGIRERTTEVKDR